MGPNAAESSIEVPHITRVVIPSIERTWEDVALLYDNQFHDSAEVEEEIENILASVPELVEIEVIGQSYQGKNITSIRITNEQNSVQKAKTLVVAHHHGREEITVEMALRFILRLVNSYGVDTTLTEYVDTMEVFVIPTLNPDALDVVVNDGNDWLRKNLRPYDNDDDGKSGEDDAEDVNGDGCISGYDVYSKSGIVENYLYTYYEGIDNDEDGQINEDEVGLVDLNRNYPTFWEDGNTDVTTQEYRGTAPFSEPETQAFRDFALKHRFAMAYSLHSGTNATFFPANELNHWFEGALYYGMAADYNDVLPDGFNNIAGYPQSSDDRIMTTTYGGWGEWMYVERGCTVPITFELYTNETVNEDEAYIVVSENATHVIYEWKGIYGYFNPVEEEINELWAEITGAFDYLLEMTPRVDFRATTITGGINAGEEVTFTLSMECLSPRLGSKNPIVVLDEDGDELDSLITLGAAQALVNHPSFTLAENLDSPGYAIVVGCNYTGYTQFILTKGSPTTSLDPLVLAAVGIGITFVVVVVAVAFMKKRS